MARIDHTLTIRSPKERVYEAITTKDGLAGWYTDAVEIVDDTVTLTFSDREGPFRWRFTGDEAAGDIRWECLSGPGDAKGTVATFALRDTPDGDTVIEFSHDGFDDGDDKLGTCNALWGSLVTRLKAFAETGNPLPAL